MKERMGITLNMRGRIFKYKTTITNWFLSSFLRVICLLFITMISIVSIDGCLRSYLYYPVLSHDQNKSYKKNGKSLVYHYENISIKIHGYAYFPSKSMFRSYFAIRVVNKSLDTLFIPYDGINPYYIGRDIEKEFFKDDKKLDLSKNLVWKIDPDSEEIIHLFLTIPSENSRKLDRHHVISFFIDKIRKVPSDTTLKFQGDFRI